MILCIASWERAAGVTSYSLSEPHPEGLSGYRDGALHQGGMQMLACL